MSEQDFLMKMQEEILDTEDEITMGTKLSDIEEWDSLAFVSFMAFASARRWMRQLPFVISIIFLGCEIDDA